MFILFIILNYFQFINSKFENAECPKYECGKIPDNYCSIKESDSYILHKCDNLYNCSFSTFSDSRCRNSEYEYDKLAYPGGKCESNNDCLISKCENDVKMKHV